MRLSLAELNELRVRDLAAYADIYTGIENKKSRKAEQSDIDRLLA